MNEALGMALALLAGSMLGTLFYGGLRWTIRKGFSSKRSALWFFGSLTIRTSLVLAGFYLAGRGSWERFLTCFLGFVVARLIVIRTMTAAGKRLRLEREARHAP